MRIQKWNSNFYCEKEKSDNRKERVKDGLDMFDLYCMIGLRLK